MTLQRYFLVHGRDADTFGQGPDELDEAHQAYMDPWVERMIARGPTLTQDGGTHTGSVHIVAVADEDEAHRFAHDEPYARAGWYREISIVEMTPILDQTMWDFAWPTGVRTSFVRASWRALPPADFGPAKIERKIDDAPQDWVFAGFLPVAGDWRPEGFVAAVDLGISDTTSLVRSLLRPVWPLLDLEVQRWQRGGRQQQQ